jgi:hypothetical protein
MAFLPLDRYETAAFAWSYGAKKYSVGNWRGVTKIEEGVSALLRHLEPLQRFLENGDPRWLHDVESWVLHTGHMSCNAAMIEQALVNLKIISDFDHSHNPSPARSKEEVSVDAFLIRMADKYGGTPSEEFMTYLYQKYGYSNEPQPVPGVPT